MSQLAPRARLWAEQVCVLLCVDNLTLYMYICLRLSVCVCVYVAKKKQLGVSLTGPTNGGGDRRYLYINHVVNLGVYVCVCVLHVCLCVYRYTHTNTHIYNPCIYVHTHNTLIIQNN